MLRCMSMVIEQVNASPPRSGTRFDHIDVRARIEPETLSCRTSRRQSRHHPVETSNGCRLGPSPRSPSPNTNPGRHRPAPSCGTNRGQSEYFHDNPSAQLGTSPSHDAPVVNIADRPGGQWPKTGAGELLIANDEIGSRFTPFAESAQTPSLRSQFQAARRPIA